MTIQHPESEASVGAMFDRIAPRYDFLNRLLSARQDQRWRRVLVDFVPYRPEGRYLDVATGTGDVLLAAREAHSEYEVFVGADISQAMLEIARTKALTQSKERALPSPKWAHAAPLPPVDFRRVSAESLCFGDQSFDCLSISFGLRNVVRRPQAIREFHRVLKVDGTLLILEFFIPRRGLISALFQLYFHTILPFIGGLVSDRAAYKYLPQSVGSFYAPDELRTVLYDGGFKVDEVVSFLFGACRLFKATRC